MVVFIELYQETGRLQQITQNMSPINFIENILGFCKKYKRSEKGAAQAGRETAHKDLLLSATKY